MFRDIWRDEYTGDKQDIKPYNFQIEENGTKIKQEIPIQRDSRKHYKIFFHCKSRNGEVGQSVIYEFVPGFN